VDPEEGTLDELRWFIGSGGKPAFLTLRLSNSSALKLIVSHSSQNLGLNFECLRVRKAGLPPLISINLNSKGY
jgi:hypothetical protein